MQEVKVAPSVFRIWRVSRQSAYLVSAPTSLLALSLSDNVILRYVKYEIRSTLHSCH